MPGVDLTTDMMGSDMLEAAKKIVGGISPIGQQSVSLMASRENGIMLNKYGPLNVLDSLLGQDFSNSATTASLMPDQGNTSALVDLTSSDPLAGVL